ncbi:MAG: hypothetical protein VX793_00180 [Pseudomonadota bacterium]|nr:hypothetical protein [Pseudomonadota bacterium]
MRDFIGQITCGGLPIVIVFGGVYASLVAVESNSDFWSKPASAFEAWDYFVLASIFIGFLTYVMIALIVASFVWLRAAAKLVGPEEAKRLYHRTYRTPSHGYGLRWNLRFVNWVLKNA